MTIFYTAARDLHRLDFVQVVAANVLNKASAILVLEVNDDKRRIFLDLNIFSLADYFRIRFCRRQMLLCVHRFYVASSISIG